MNRFLLAALILMMLAIVVGWVSSSLLQRRIMKPVSDLSSAMQRVTNEKVCSSRVSVDGDDEIANLGNGFNAMLSELERREGEKAEFEAKLEFQASNDALTGLPNRRMFADRLTKALALAQREARIVSLLYIDLDGFKLVNDSLGHSIGDSLLVQVAERFRTRVRKSDTLARIGGDEFTLILSSMHVREDAMSVAIDLLGTLTEPFEVEGHLLTITASAGISVYPENALSRVPLN